MTQQAGLTTIEWPDAEGPFNVYRGALWPGRRHAYNHGCMQRAVTEQSAVDPASPLSGVAFYYLVTSTAPLPERSRCPHTIGAPCSTTGKANFGVQQLRDNC